MSIDYILDFMRMKLRNARIKHEELTLAAKQLRTLALTQELSENDKIFLIGLEREIYGDKPDGQTSKANQ